MVWFFSLLALIICTAAWWEGVTALSARAGQLSHIKGWEALTNADKRGQSLLTALLLANFINIVFMLLLVGDLHNAKAMANAMDTQYLAWKMFDCIIGSGILAFIKYLEHSDEHVY